ncbi:hypothetical protein [Chitinophaga sp.]|uniref:hypothetical protein n=1 Tax=Chitinophaga sp. TaxID=1869181 RepID=UPI0031DBDA7C
MRRCFCIFLFLFCSQAVWSQSLAELEKQLDSLLRKREKSELIIGVGYGNNPAYGSKVNNGERPVVMKTFLSPTLGYYHKSGFYGTASNYYLFNSLGTPWFEWDFSAGYDYSKSKHFMTGVSYTRYIFADSADVPATPINNELFAYFYYRDWWVQPGISLDFGWGSCEEAKGPKGPNGEPALTRHLSGNDFNIVAAVRHPFIFVDVLKTDDAFLLTPSVGLTMGTARYYSNLRAFQYISRSPWMKGNEPHEVFHPATTRKSNTGFEMRALDLTVSASYIVGKFTLAPSYTIFKPFQGEDKKLVNYFTARIAYTLKK